MKQIGERLGLDESRVSQLHAATLARLRTRVKVMLRPLPGVARTGAPALALSNHGPIAENLYYWMKPAKRYNINVRSHILQGRNHHGNQSQYH